MTPTKLRRLREAVAQTGAQALLVTEPANVRYLSAFSSPADGRVLVTEERAVLLTDARYIVQAQEEARGEVAILPRNWPAELSGLLGGRRLALEADHLSFASFKKMAQLLEQEPVASEGLVAELRLVKEPAEIDLLRQAARLTDEAFGHILGFIGVGRREVEVAVELERFMRLQGAESKSFEIIVASGARSAMPHGVASSKVIAAGELVTLDFGAKVDGYHADMTRAVAVGEVNGRLRELFDATLRAQETVLAAVAPGQDGKDLDALARGVLAEAGLESYLAHGLGHGVGLSIHEGPSLRKELSQRLQAGMTVTVEPGVYLPGFGGVRIEDLVVVTADGAETLSKSPKTWLQC
jgi:Xaa-Pro aminopeptidase